MRKLVTQVLTSHGATTISGVGRLNQAWEMLVQTAKEGKPFQMIICDWHMPDGSGVDFAKKCRAHPIYKDVGFLMLTTETKIDNVVNAMLAGIDNYDVKPVQEDVLLRKLRAIAKKRFTD